MKKAFRPKYARLVELTEKELECVTYGDRQALQLAPGLYLGGKQSAAYPKLALVPLASGMGD